MTVTETGTVSQVGPDDRLPPRLAFHIFLRDQGLLLLWLVAIVVFAIWGAPYFFTVATGLSILNSAAITAIFAAGIGVGVMVGVLDISVPGVAAVAGVTVGLLMKADFPVWGAILVGLAIGLIAGAVNGVIAVRGLDPLIVTIGMLSVTSGLALLLSGGYNVAGLGDLAFLGTAYYFGIPAPVIVTVLLFAVLTLILKTTRGGMRLLAVGGNAEAARRVGIAVDGYRIAGFMVSGFCAALGGIVTAAYISTATPTASTGVIFDALTAVALGGVPFVGGRGSLPRVLLGAVVLATISAGLLIAGVQTYWGTVATGVLLVGGLALQRWTTRSVSGLILRGQPSGKAGR